MLDNFPLLRRTLIGLRVTEIFFKLLSRFKSLDTWKYKLKKTGSVSTEVWIQCLSYGHSLSF